MKEIIYIQAGNYSNYIGTHFWNAQDAYLAEKTAEPTYNSDVSFQEDLNSERYHPRLLIFDHKNNFGPLAKSNLFVGNNQSSPQAEDLPAIWTKGIVEYRSDPITHDPFGLEQQAQLLNSREMYSQTPANARPLVDVKFWSDFNRVSYTPRTIQKIPDPKDWENPEGDWNLGKSSFSRYDEDQALMEGDLRLFLEECDSPQGLQVINDTSTFGGFTDSFLTSFRDHYEKMPSLVIPVLSDAASRQASSEDYIGMRKAVNDALYLRSLNEMALLSIPIQPPGVWSEIARNRYPTVDQHNPYHNSATLSALVETATLSLRNNTLKDDLDTMAQKLNWRGTTKFCELKGIFPFSSAEDFDTRLINFLASRVEHDGANSTQFTRLDATRGFTPSGISVYEQWSAGQKLQDTFITRTHAAPYPIPISHPLFFGSTLGTSKSRGRDNPKHCSVFSSLSTGSSTARLFSSYASVIEGYSSKRKIDPDKFGIDGDELKELVNDLRNLHDGYGDDDGGSDQEDTLGEDEA